MDTISLKIPPELNKKLEHFAMLGERPKSYLVRKAIEEFLMDMEEDEADYKAALARVKDPKAEYVSWEKVEEDLGLARRH